MTIGEMRVAAAFDRYRAACAAYGIATDGWAIIPGRLRPRPEDCVPWRIDNGHAAPGFAPDGILGPHATAAVSLLAFATKVVRDLTP